MATLITGHGVSARILGQDSFTVTNDALGMIKVFGGLLHCYQGNGDCRKQALISHGRNQRNPFAACSMPRDTPVAIPPSNGTGRAKKGW